MPYRCILLRLLRRATGPALAAGVILWGPIKGIEGQAPLPQTAAPDMSRVAGPDASIIPPIVPREFRGVWVSSTDGGDWPSRKGLSAEQQQQELIKLLDRARAIGLNAIVFHVRLSGDALYSTPLAPWSAKLTGTQGLDPGYDPLAFVVREAHARGLQVHAWFNPFRASLDGGIRAAPTHVTRANRGWVVRYGSQLWIDPGLPEARESVIATIVDVVQRYDVDGVHLDDYFYPYRETRTFSRRVGRKHHRHMVYSTRELDFPDAKSWHRNGTRLGWTERDAWRRHNMDDFVATLYRRVHETKPWVLVGLSPFGIWRPGTPAGVNGLDAYREIYADSRKWLREGWVDYLAPQLYWQIDGPQNRFRALDAWWRTQNPRGRHVWPGLFTANVVGPADWGLDEIPRQIAALRAARQGSAESNGHIHFRMGSLSPSTGSLAGALGDHLAFEDYRVPALVPEVPWLGGKPPTAPLAVVTDPSDVRGPMLLMAVRDSTPLAWWLVQARGADGRWAMRLLPASTRQLLLTELIAAPEVVVVRVIDRVGQVSPQTTVRVGGRH